MEDTLLRPMLLLRACGALLLLGGCLLPSQLNGAYRDLIGYQRLAEELQLRNLPLPTGAGLRVTQVEGSFSGNYKPNPTDAQFTGITFHIQSGESGNSGHATSVGRNLYGATTSMAYGITDVDVYEANDWLSSKGYNGTNPQVEANPLQNHSWVGSGTDTVSRSLDFAIQRDGFLAVVGMPNSDTDGADVPTIYAQSHNSISVGLVNGTHKSGLTSSDGAGRIKPEIVSISSFTSFATPHVTATAALLIEAAGEDEAARDQLTLKAILLAAADKTPFPEWSRTSTLPIDTQFGAGRLDVYESYWIQHAGQQSHGSTPIKPRGWDLSTISGTPRTYTLEIPPGFRLEDFSVLITWNRTIERTSRGPNFSFSPTSYNLNLRLRDDQGATVDESISEVQNLEHLWLAGEASLAAGSYTLEVSQVTSGTDVPYAIAWRGRLLQDFGGWAENVFPEGTDEADMAPNADPDGDGVVNLMEYALGLDPLTPSAEGLPTAAISEQADEAFLTLSYTRPTHDTGIIYTVESSTDLENWSSTPTEVVPVAIEMHPDGVREVHTYRRVNPIGSDTRGFLRLRVSESP